MIRQTSSAESEEVSSGSQLVFPSTWAALYAGASFSLQVLLSAGSTSA